MTTDLRAKGSLFGVSRLKLNVILDADVGDQAELGLDEVDVILFRLENVAEQVADDEITDSFAMSDPFAQSRQRFLFKPKIALEDLLYALADQQLVEILQIGQSIEKENAVDQRTPRVWSRPNAAACGRAGNTD